MKSCKRHWLNIASKSWWGALGRIALCERMCHRRKWRFEFLAVDWARSEAKEAIELGLVYCPGRPETGYESVHP